MRFLCGFYSLSLRMMHEEDIQLQDRLSRLPHLDEVISAALQQPIEHGLSSPQLRPQLMTPIHRVPRELREDNEQHFTPTAISIGPLHAGNEKLEDGEELKKWFLSSFLSHFPDESILPSVICLLVSLETEARQSYAENFENLGQEEFVKMMLLDGCFIIEFILWLSGFGTRAGPMPVGRAKWPLHYVIGYDLLLLENQLPFFILQNIYKVCQLQSNELNLRTLEFLAGLFFLSRGLPMEINPLSCPRNPSHLLELVLCILFPRAVGQRAGMQLSPETWCCKNTASEQALYGIKFEGVRDMHSVEDVKFDKGVLKMPRFEVRETTPSLFKNLVALEQCSYEKYSAYFTSFLFLMDILIDTERDVEILLEGRVMQPRFDDKVGLRSLFNNNITLRLIYDPTKFHYAHVFKAMAEYRKNRIPRFRAYFMRYYYALRWDILNSSLQFVLTVTQTLFAILSFNP